MAPTPGSIAPLEVSRAADITREVQIVALPALQGGKPIVVKVAAVEIIELLAALEGVPNANAAPAAGRVVAFSEVREGIIQSAGPSKKVAALGLIEPAFAFEQREDGKAYWGDLLMENQAAVIAAIMELSGLKGDAAKQAGTFPAGAGSDGAASGVVAPAG